jgi:hypothetical protein
MITVNELIEDLIRLQEEGLGDLPVIYSEDPEGNNYHLLTNLPSEEMYNRDGGEIDFTPNCIIIN